MCNKKNLGCEKEKMITKNKQIAMVEIAIVLCSVLLVAIPAIAAEQNQAMQELSASEITAASEDNYVLGIYGNANEDDTIDMGDVVYIKLAIFGKKSKTELCDAKYDGRINVLDVIQTKLIILGKEKELTIVQYFGSTPPFTEEPVTVNQPIERIIVITTDTAGMVCALGEQDKIVGVCNYVNKQGELKIFLQDRTSVGSSWQTWDMEQIIDLKPDIVLVYAVRSTTFSGYEETLNVAGIQLVQMDFSKSAKYFREIRNLGWMLDKNERAEELINFEQQHLDLIKERVEDLKPEQKPRVFFEFWFDLRGMGSGTADHEHLIACGGINILEDIEGSVTIDPEIVLERNPHVILKEITAYTHSGYDVTDTSQLEELRDKIMSRPGWDNIDAVKNGRVYIISRHSKATHPCVFNSYIAKWLHPELFEDVDPVDIHREWFQKFFGIEYKGVYAYPTYPVS